MNEAVNLESPKLLRASIQPSSSILFNKTPPPTSRAISSTSRSANKSNRSNKSNKANKSSSSSTTTPLVSFPTTTKSLSRSSSIADTSIGSLNSPFASPANSIVNSPVNSPINSPVKSFKLDNPVVTDDNIDTVVETPSTSRLTTLIEKVANTPAKITTPTSTVLETTLTPTKIDTPRKSLSGVSSARVSTSSTIQPTTLTPTRISASSRPKRFLKNKRIQTWRGERPIYVPLENGCYKIIGTSAPHTPDFMKRKNDTTKEKLSKIFLNRENLNWKKLKVHKNLEHATLITANEANQTVGYFRFIEKCDKPVNKTGQYLSLYILMEGSISIKIENDPPALIKKLDPVIIPPETNYSMENMIDGESMLFFAIL
ncbi:putative protein TPRXL [Panonychus citri]|uniref:putative protein TPRXL n=1 Tax=Panonychus citri TaxID=50023 RepID=UPI002307A011|nr:putative protein TPRXL [Panonychus citri]